MRCEMLPTILLISLKRFGPPSRTITTSTLHLSPIRARTSLTDLQFSITTVCLGFKPVPSCGYSPVTNIALVTNQYHCEARLMKLLHVDSSILGDHSVSRQLSSAIVAKLR